MDSFFGIGLPELIVVLIIAGIVMGPERIGQAARWLGRTTAQLQRISRGFMRQLNEELNSVDDGQAIQETMQDIKELRQELAELRGELTTATNEAAQEGSKAVKDIERSIQPPSLTKPPALDAETETEPVSETAENNGVSPKTQPQSPPKLPNPIDVPDDPE